MKRKAKSKAYFTDQKVLPPKESETAHRLKEQEERTFPRDPNRARKRTVKRA